MNERESFGQILATAFTGAMIGASLFVAAVVLHSWLPSGNDAPTGLGVGLALFALFIGWLVALLTAWPVGTVIGWLLSRTGPSTGRRATTAGGLTGFALMAVVVLLDMRSPYDQSSEVWLLLWGFALLGAVSGWLAYRLVLRPKSTSE